jgi:hypothetical protein
MATELMLGRTIVDAFHEEEPTRDCMADHMAGQLLHPK